MQNHKPEHLEDLTKELARSAWEGILDTAALRVTCEQQGESDGSRSCRLRFPYQMAYKDQSKREGVVADNEWRHLDSDDTLSEYVQMVERMIQEYHVRVVRKDNTILVPAYEMGKPVMTVGEAADLLNSQGSQRVSAAKVTHDYARLYDREPKGICISGPGLMLLAHKMLRLSADETLGRIRAFFSGRNACA